MRLAGRFLLIAFRAVNIYFYCAFHTLNTSRTDKAGRHFIEMKRCPECRRNYADETLNFCLDDGAPLELAEPATAFLERGPAVAPAPSGEDLTRNFESDGARVPVGNLPAERTTFVGREKELVACVRLLEVTRLLTLAGFGGCGKTRLAIKLARTLNGRFAGGAWFADLATVTEAAMVSPVVGRLFGLQEEAGKSPSESLADEIGHKEMILILDNCEHLLAECSRVADALLDRCPNIRIVATTREALNVRGEHVFPLKPLSVEPADAITDDAVEIRSDAARLFVDRVRCVNTNFTMTPGNSLAVEEIARRLDGIPLAIELAAARAKVLTVEQIRTMLSERFRLLSAGRTFTPRHRTLQAAIEWSYDPLLADEKHMLGAVSVFAGGCDLGSVTEVAGSTDKFQVLEVLSRLADKSLIVVEDAAGSQKRYSLLETVKEFVLDSLAAQGQLAEFREAHLGAMLALAERAYVGRATSEEAWLNILESERANMRAALEFARGRDPEKYLALAGALGWFWIARSHIFEGREHLTTALAATGPEPVRPARARALWGAAHMLAWQGDELAAKACMDEALDAWRALEDASEVALAFEGIGWTQFYSSDDEAARTSFEECLRLQRAGADPALVNRAMVGLAQVLVALDRTAEARPMAQEIIEFSTAHNDKRSEHFGWHYLADCALIDRDYTGSLELYRRSLALADALGDKVETGFEIEGVAMSLAGQGRSTEAIVLAAAVAAEMDRIGANVHVRFWDALTDRYFGAAKQDLGDVSYGSALEQGSRIPFEEAVRIALTFRVPASTSDTGRTDYPK